MSYQFSGSLQTKKKGELQIIAQQLGEPDGGTRDDLVKVITRRLENSPQLEQDSRFSGLFTSRIRQRSVQPADAGEVHDVKPSKRSKVRDFTPVVEEPEREGTPTAEMQDVSMMLKRAPQSPGALPTPSPPRVGLSPRSVPLPPTPAKSVASISEVLESPQSRALVQASNNAVIGFQQYVAATRIVCRRPTLL